MPAGAETNTGGGQDASAARARITLCGAVAPGRYTRRKPATPPSVLELLGLKPVPGCWSGLAGLPSTQEGLQRILTARPPGTLIPFRAVCRLPGPLVSPIRRADFPALGYLHLMDVEPELVEELYPLWWPPGASSDDAPDGPIATYPWRARAALERMGLGRLRLVVHLCLPAPDADPLLVGTVLDPACIESAHTSLGSLPLRL